ncbi:response regulator transcription factor [Rhodococcus erythropolis]|uniref:response regulator transcription factor n=1 Tax=Rhodococcus erythropolis TaxID=1833 RepID=UPI0003FE6906|nr:putative sensory transduction protein [Rhodococcus erythropolis]
MEAMNTTATRRIDDPPGYRALVVDDERTLTAIVAGYLERESFQVSAAYDGRTALTLAREVDPDVVVLDLGLPGLDGIEVCRELRAFSDAYVVMLTARSDEVDTLIGLSVGADDYMSKPFSPRELVARIRAMMRRPRNLPAHGNSTRSAHQAEQPPRRFGRLSIDAAGREVFVADRPAMLTRTEFDLLAVLSGRPGMVFSRRTLIETVWGETWTGNEHLVDVHIGHLRRKLGDDPAAPIYVMTVRGVGYKMGTGQ